MASTPNLSQFQDALSPIYAQSHLQSQKVMGQLYRTRGTRLGSIPASLPNFVPDDGKRSISQVSRAKNPASKSQPQTRDDSTLKAQQLEQAILSNPLTMKYLRLTDCRLHEPPAIPSETEAFKRKLEKTKFYIDLNSRPQPPPPKPPTPPEPGPQVAYTEHMDIFALREREQHFVKVLRETAEHLNAQIKETQDVEQRYQKIEKLEKTYDQEATEYQEIREKVQGEMDLMLTETQSLNKLDQFLDKKALDIETVLTAQIQMIQAQLGQLEIYLAAKRMIFDLCQMTTAKEQVDKQLAYESDFQQALTEFGRVSAVLAYQDHNTSFEDTLNSTASMSRDASFIKKYSFIGNSMLRNTSKQQLLSGSILKGFVRQLAPIDSLRQSTKTNMNLVRMEAKVQLKQNSSTKNQLVQEGAAKPGITSGFEALKEITQYLQTHKDHAYDSRFILRLKQVLRDSHKYVVLNKPSQKTKYNIQLDIEEIEDHMDEVLDGIKSLQYRDIMASNWLSFNTPVFSQLFPPTEKEANDAEQRLRFKIRNVLAHIKFRGGLEGIAYRPFETLGRLQVSAQMAPKEILGHFLRFFGKSWNKRNMYHFSFEKAAFLLQPQPEHLTFLEVPHLPTFSVPFISVDPTVAQAMALLLKTAPRAQYPFYCAKELADELYESTQKIEILKASTESFQDILDEHRINAAALQSQIPEKQDLSQNIKQMEQSLRDVQTQALEASQIYERLSGSSTEEIDAKRTLAKKLKQYKCVDGIELVLRREEALQNCPHRIDDYKTGADVRCQGVKDGILILRQALEHMLVDMGFLAQSSAEKLNIEPLLRFLEDKIYEAEARLEKHDKALIYEQRKHLDHKRKAESRNRSLQSIIQSAPRQTEEQRIALLKQYEEEDRRATEQRHSHSSLPNSKYQGPKVQTGKQLALQKEIAKMQDFSQPPESQNFYQ